MIRKTNFRSSAKYYIHTHRKIKTTYGFNARRKSQQDLINSFFKNFASGLC